MDYLLNVPLEMFLPYLTVGLLTSFVVSKMVDLGSSKWKTVVSLCSQSAYCCRDDFANCCPSGNSQGKESFIRTDTPAVDRTDGISSPQHVLVQEESFPKEGSAAQVCYCGIPFEKRSDLMPFYFLVPPPRQALKETANVVITVCLGFLLLITNIPKLILLALELENYVELDPTFVRMLKECLIMAFIVLKPPIYLMLGVHFRHALTGLCCCACLYAPVIKGVGHLNSRTEQNEQETYDNDDEGPVYAPEVLPERRGDLTSVMEEGHSSDK